MVIKEKIYELFDYIDNHALEEGNRLKKHLDYVDSEWNKLYSKKNDDSDRTLLALPMIDLTLKIKKFEMAKKWIDIYLDHESSEDEISLYNGKLEFEKLNYQKAHSLFKKSFELSNGRMMEGEGIYLDFYLNPEKYMND